MGAIHLLFSANRWECAKSIEKALSRVAYSSAKGLDMDWCRKPDVGLPTPDRVFYLDVDPETAKKRSQYGEERYEKAEFQAKVGTQFKTFFQEKFWVRLDAGREMDALSAEIQNLVTSDIEDLKTSPKPIGKLWV